MKKEEKAVIEQIYNGLESGYMEWIPEIPKELCIIEHFVVGVLERMWDKLEDVKRVAYIHVILDKIDAHLGDEMPTMFLLGQIIHFLNKHKPIAQMMKTEYGYDDLLERMIRMNAMSSNYLLPEMVYLDRFVKVRQEMGAVLEPDAPIPIHF